MVDTYLDLVTVVSTGPEITYGVPELRSANLLRVEDGFWDLTTGVLGVGLGRITGTVKEWADPNAPVHRRIQLFRVFDGVVIREVWSDPTTGAYTLNYIDELQVWTVISYDHTGAFSAVVASGLTTANGGVELIA